MVTGKVAEDDAVPKAVVKALVMLAMNLNGIVRVQTAKMMGSTTKPWIPKPTRTVVKYKNKTIE
jgi:hypothetical protein